jgi:hypothetical protein
MLVRNNNYRTISARCQHLLPSGDLLPLAASRLYFLHGAATEAYDDKEDASMMETGRSNF